MDGFGRSSEIERLCAALVVFEREDGEKEVGGWDAVGGGGVGVGVVGTGCCVDWDWDRV